MPGSEGRLRRRVLTVASVVAMALLTGCTEPGLQTEQGVPWSEWKNPTTAPVTFSGTTTDGTTFTSKEHLGTVVVVNFWYAECGPCRAEASTLNAVAKAIPEVQFVGIDVSDDATTAAGFERTHRTIYPSIVDQEQDASAQLAFAASRPPKAVPSTLILDRKGRVTARIVGQVNESVLTTLVHDAVDRTSSEAAGRALRWTGIAFPS